MSTKNITVTKAFKEVPCGSVESFLDKHGNTLYMAKNIIDKEEFSFYNEGAACHWLTLVGLVRG